MTRGPHYTAAELDDLEVLPIRIPGYEHGASHPFSSGIPEKYTRETLLKMSDDKSFRTDFFEKKLLGIWLAIGRPVPYAFRPRDGAYRSLDAGCLGYLANRKVPEVELHLGGDGYVIAVTPMACLHDRYGNELADRFRDEVALPGEGD